MEGPIGVELQRRLFTVDEYYAMARAGVLHEDDRVELINGEIVEMSPIGVRHAACVKRLANLFARLLGGRVVVSVQDPVRLGDLSEPQPDVVLLRPKDDFYETAHPGPDDVLLLVEVADSSLATDREVKIPLYALSSVSEAWVVDLEGDAVEVHRSPTGGRYAEVERMGREGRLRPTAFPDLELGAREILG